jgi:hypothetical protein
VRKENRLGSLQKSKEKKLASNKGGILTGGWRKLHNSELRNLRSSETTSVTESRKLVVAVQVKHVVEVIYTCKILVGNS